MTLDELTSKLNTEEIDTLLFRGEPIDMGLPRVFGGQVLGQCLNAADRTVGEDRFPHSLHGYFLRPGDTSRPIIYEVDPIRDGRSFATRRVVAKQRGEAIFNASISFQKREGGLAHQMAFPDNVPPPEDIEHDFYHAEKLVKKYPGMTLEKFRTWYLIFDPDVIDIRTPHLAQVIQPGEYDPSFGFWFKVNGVMADDPIMHRNLLAFISDKALMSTSLQPHNVNYSTHKIIGASLDHAMWFHGDIKVDQWLYYHLDSPRASGGRGLNRGSFFTRDGDLIASTAQEGLIRVVGQA